MNMIAIWTLPENLQAHSKMSSGAREQAVTRFPETLGIHWLMVIIYFVTEDISETFRNVFLNIVSEWAQEQQRPLI